MSAAWTLTRFCWLQHCGTWRAALSFFHCPIASLTSRSTTAYDCTAKRNAN
ncbi:hypothetical protein PR001_g25712 [Phytophthora rubi]|uniref:RxLR effector protein n=1 Tax=Phytophthora rubi TaxID=129364 RepID=A0A6A3I5R7_9STRA|nr:hypothetical protein PR001_g25712 [Phytophthora rubi]